MNRSYEVKDTLIRIESVGVKYGDKVILDGVSAEVRDIVRPGCITGQIIGILGPSGIGKSQLSRVMTGLQKPTSGQVTVGSHGKVVEVGLVGYVPQNYPLFDHRRVFSNLMVAAKKTSRSSKEAEDKCKEYLVRFGLDDKRDYFPAELSGGQRQRVAIVQQLLCSEHYLILDEPTTGLDPIMKDRVIGLIRQVAGLSEENTIFLVSHDISVVLSVADHIWLLGRTRDKDGKSLGAKIAFSYDLIERGIAWEADPQSLPAFHELAKEIRSQFENL